jgi:hypothetical protein
VLPEYSISIVFSLKKSRIVAEFFNSSKNVIKRYVIRSLPNNLHTSLYSSCSQACHLWNFLSFEFSFDFENSEAQISPPSWMLTIFSTNLTLEPKILKELPFRCYFYSAAHVWLSDKVCVLFIKLSKALREDILICAGSWIIFNLIVIFGWLLFCIIILPKHDKLLNG